MSRKLEASLKKADKVFDKCFEKGITPSGKRWSENGKNTYANLFKAFVRAYHKEYGVSDITKMTDEDKINQLIQKRVDGYHSGKTGEAFNVKTLTAALKAFNHGVANTNVFKKPFSVGNTDEIRKNLKAQHVMRYSGTSTVLRATPAESQSVLDKIKNTGYNVKTREVAYHVGKISMATGGRISAILKLTPSDFVIDRKTNEIHFIKDKGGLTRSVRVGRDTAEYFEKLRDGKKDNEVVFSRIRTKRNVGTFKPVSELRKEVEKIISNAGEHLTKSTKVTIKDRNGKPKTVEVTQKFTPHSFRKSFALERTNYYFSKFDSKSALDSYVSRRINDDKKIKQKLDTLRERVNRDRTTARALTNEEYAIFFASVDMGHFRNDVITSFYTTFKEIREYLKDK